MRGLTPVTCADLCRVALRQNIHRAVRAEPGQGAVHLADPGAGLGQLHVQGPLRHQPGGHQVLRAGRLQ